MYHSEMLPHAEILMAHTHINLAKPQR